MTTGKHDPWEAVRSVDAPLTDSAAGQQEGSGDRQASQRYERRSTVARGGMGQVDVVRDRWLGRDVARKVVLEDRPDDRLVREAELTAGLDHPGIVTVLDTGTDEQGRRFYTMRLVRGASLATRLASADLPARLAQLPALLAVARAVEYAHEAGIVHRDLKPDNVTVGQFGEVQLIDWGIAARIGDDGRAEGTPPYADPDQLAGDRVAATHDVYALGRCLEHVLRGELPAPDTDFPPEVPAELVAIVDQATQPIAEDRYADAGALADDLQAWLAGRPVSAHAYSPREHLQRAVRAYRRPLAVAGVASVVIAAVSVWTLVQTRRERDRALEAEAVASDRLAALLVEQGVAAFAEGRLAEAERAAAQALLHSDDPLGRGLLAADQRARPMLLSAGQLPCEGVQLLSDGRLACPADEAVRVLGADTETTLAAPGVEQVLLVGDHLVTARTVSGQGRQLEMTFFQADGRRVRSVTVPLAALSAQGPRLLVHHLYGQTLSADGSDVSSWAPCPPTSPPMATPAWTPSGHPAWACEDHVAWGEPLQVHPVEEGVAALGPWGEDLLVAFYDGTLARIGAEGEQWRVSIPGGTSTRVLADAGLVVVAPERGGVALMDVRNGHWLGTLPTGQAPQLAVSDGVLTVVTDRLRRWELPAPAIPPLLPMPGGVTSLAFAEDGSLAVGAHDQVVLVTPDGQRVVSAQGPDCTPVKDVAWLGERVLRGCATVSRPLALVDRQGRTEEIGRALGAPRVVAGPDWGVASTYGQHHAWVDPASETLRMVDTEVSWVDLESDGHTVWALGEDGRVRALTPGAGPAATGVGADGALGLAVAPGAVGFLLGEGRTVWRVDPSGEERWRREVPERLTDLAWSPRGDLVAVGTLRGHTWVLEASTGEVVAELPGHDERVAAVAFSQDGGVLATGSWDHTVRRWRTDAMREPDPLDAIEARYGWSGD